MEKILSIVEVTKVVLPDGYYIGAMSGNSIMMIYNSKQYELTAKEGIRGCSQVIVIVKDGTYGYEFLENGKQPHELVGNPKVGPQQDVELTIHNIKAFNPNDI